MARALEKTAGICGAHSGRPDPDGDGSPWSGHEIDAVDPAISTPPRGIRILTSWASLLQTKGSMLYE